MKLGAVHVMKRKAHLDMLPPNGPFVERMTTLCHEMNGRGDFKCQTHITILAFIILHTNV